MSKSSQRLSIADRAHEITCVGARVDLATPYRIHPGSAHVVRNDRGNARDVLRSLVVLEQFLGGTEIPLIKHTECGMRTVRNEVAFTTIAKNLSERRTLGAGRSKYSAFSTA